MNSVLVRSLCVLGLSIALNSGPAAAVTTVSMDFLDPGSPVNGATMINGVGVAVQGGPGSQTGKSFVCLDVITGCGAAAVADARLNFKNGTFFDMDRFVPD